MKPTHIQLGVRENTASSRQHASRLAVNATCIQEQTRQTQQSGTRTARFSTAFENRSQAALRNAATGERRSDENRLLTVPEVAELLRVPVSWVYGRTRKRSLERLPGYRLGKYWRFNQADVLAWIERQRSLTR